MLEKSSFASLRGNNRGSSFIETALMVPLLLMMCCGAMDFARVIYSGVEVANAARAGVQYGALRPGNAGDLTGMANAAVADAADLGTTVTATATNFCACDGSPVDCSTSCSGATPDGYVSVTANYTFSTLVRYPGLPASVVLSRTAQMRVQ